MSTLVLSRSISFRVPCQDKEPESIIEKPTPKPAFDKLLNLILAGNPGCKITKDTGLNDREIEKQLTADFIKYGTEAKKPLPIDIMQSDKVVITGNRIEIKKEWLEETLCALSLQSFAYCRNPDDSYLIELSADRLVISSDPIA